MFRRIILLGAIAILFTGCYPNRMGLVGILYSGYTEGLSATAQMSVKKGEACAMSILGIVAIGDASIDTARKNGGIRSISSVDEDFSMFLGGLYSSKCTVVRGK